MVHTLRIKSDLPQRKARAIASIFTEAKRIIKRMPESLQPYSEHIYDQARIDLASMILAKECRKLFLGLSEEVWQAMDDSIHGWAENPASYHLEDDGPRDFWDSFAAFMESVKLKPNFTAWITAENVQWHKATLPVRQIQMTSPLEQLKKVPGLNVRNDLPFMELADVFTRNPHIVDEQRKLIDKYSTDPAQDAYPIIVRETGGRLFKVMDGNRRTLKSVIYGQTEIEAWVGRIDGAQPVNYWVPLNDMFQLVKIFGEAVDSDDEQTQQAVAEVLKSRFRASTVAEQAYQNRIGNQTEVAKRLFNLAQQA